MGVLRIVPPEIVQAPVCMLGSGEFVELGLIDTPDLVSGREEFDRIIYVAWMIQQQRPITLCQGNACSQLLQDLDEDFVALAMDVCEIDVLELAFFPRTASECPLVIIGTLAVLRVFVSSLAVDKPLRLLATACHALQDRLSACALERV